MSKDDYDVMVYRILVYLYACLKRKIMFEEATFYAAVRKNVSSDEYFADILTMMQDEGLIEGVLSISAWGGDSILVSSLQDARITPNGIHYLQENNKMNQIGNALKEAVDTIAKLASIAGLFSK